MTDLHFYTNPMSRGRIIRWMLEETGAPYETHFVRYGDEMKGPAYRAINPMGKVPAIKHGEHIVTECAAICAYLADAFPEANLAPPTNQRADYYRWLFFAAGPVEAAITNKALEVDVDTPSQMAGYGTFDEMRNTLIGAISQNQWVCGDQFTAADVYIGSQIGWGLQFGTLPPSPELEAYRDRCYARDAHKRGTESDDAAMAEYGPEMPG